MNKAAVRVMGIYLVLIKYKWINKTNEMYIIKVFDIEVTNQICPGNRWYHSYYASKSLPQNTHPPHPTF